MKSNLPDIITIEKYGRYWALYLHGRLVCLTVYKRGSTELASILYDLIEGNEVLHV